MSISANLQGKTALVTGASSQGFGRYFAQELAASGASVVVTARRQQPLDELANSIQASGGKATAQSADVQDLQAIKGLIDQHGPFDIVVNNAGVSVPKPLLDLTAEDYNFVIGVNLTGVWNVATEAARSMRDNNIAGSIINISSITGIRQATQLAPYAVSKSGVIQMTKQMALELARYKIRVNAIAPGYFESDLTHELFETEAGAALIKRIPLRRLGDYPSLRGPLLMLASDDSPYLTGSVIAVDGALSVNSV